MGKSVSGATKYNYAGQFRKWAAHRSINGLIPYIGGNCISQREEEAIVLAYLALYLAPMGGNRSTANGHRCAIGHFRKLRGGSNSLTSMPRLLLMQKGMIMPKGHTARKLPTAVEDLRTFKGLLYLNDASRRIMWRTNLLGRFFMLRMGE